MKQAPLITSVQNPAVQRLRALADPRARRREGVVLIEGVRLVEEALSQNLALVEVAVSPRLERDERGRALGLALERSEAYLHRTSDRVLAAMADVETHQGVVAVAERPSHNPERVAAVAANPLVVAQGIQDPGNLGALVRVADAASAAGVLVVGGADPFSPKALRASAGSAFRVPLAEVTDCEALLALLAATGRKLLVAVHHGGESCFTADLSGRAALAFGGEGAGLAPTLVVAAALRISVPMKAGVESLNLVAAAAVILFEATRARSRA